MIPAAIVGVLLKNKSSTYLVKIFSWYAWCWCLQVFLLFLADKSKVNNKNVKSYLDAHHHRRCSSYRHHSRISRSEATISTKRFVGYWQTKAAEFSFLMVVPLIFGKIAKDLLEGEFGTVKFDALTLSARFLAAFVTGVLACTWMIKIVRNSTLEVLCILLSCYWIGRGLFMSHLPNDYRQAFKIDTSIVEKGAVLLICKTFDLVFVWCC